MIRAESKIIGSESVKVDRIALSISVGFACLPHHTKKIWTKLGTIGRVLSIEVTYTIVVSDQELVHIMYRLSKAKQGCQSEWSAKDVVAKDIYKISVIRVCGLRDDAWEEDAHGITFYN